MSQKFEVIAEPRVAKGTGASRRLRHEGKVPGIVYGAGKEPVAVVFDHNAMFRQLGQEAFHTSILTLQLNGAKDQAILRDYQVHPVKPLVMHVDLQRISATEKIHMRVPLHFLGQDAAPGVKQEGGLVSHLMTEVDITCLPADLPEYLEVDMSNVHLNQSVHLSDLKLPSGVAISQLVHGNDLAVATITAVRVEEEAPAAAAEAAPAAGEVAAAAPAAGADAKKAEAKKPEAKK
ncbi:MAG: 50S ribosomal protein L25/general stress protein Ctc [Gammaproteobacteria bacterium]|nr:50S ribosomal protein L25/general stress protein Ctc [Gammaproteobacteria bacterium]